MASGEKKKLLLGVTVFVPEGEGCEAMQDVSADGWPDAVVHGWQTRKFQLKDMNSVPRAVLEEIGISFLAFDSSAAGVFLLGELFIERTSDNTGNKSTKDNFSDEGLVTSDRKHVTSSRQNPHGGRYPVHTYLTSHTEEENDEGKHKSEKLHRYSHCTKGFTRKSNPVVQIPTKPRDRSYDCNLCGRNFLYNSDLVRHLLIHSGDRPYRCEYCGRSFQQQPHLEGHLRVHTGKRPYHCEYCYFSFSQHSHLTTHLCIHMGDRPFKCEYCSHSFSRKGHLTSHLQHMHKLPSRLTGATTGGKTSRQEGK